MFIGSNTGMFVYDISNPASPVKEGQFQHALVRGGRDGWGCDPGLQTIIMLMLLYIQVPHVADLLMCLM
jgi:hypothetical protein